MPALPASGNTAWSPEDDPLEVVMARESGPDFEREWPEPDIAQTASWCGRG
jgi:hypothetical protein